MKALVIHDKFDYRYEDVPKPVAGPGELVLKVKGCSICAGDIKGWQGAPASWGTSKKDRPLRDGFLWGFLRLGGSADGANARAGTAGNAGVSVDHLLNECCCRTNAC